MKAILPLAAVLLLGALSARAEDVVTNFANAAAEQIVLDAGGESAAQAFTSGPQPRTLDRIVVRLRGFQSGPHQARVKLWLGAGAVPETLVEGLGTAVNIPSGTDGDMTVLSTARPVLAPNTRYWVSVTNVAGDFDWLNTSNQASTGTGAVVQARAESATGNAGSWSAFGSAANFQFMRVETRSALAVTTDANAGAGSLRQAVADAATLGGPDFILFDPSLSGKTITLTGGEIVLNTDVTIDATALPGGVTISGNNVTRIFFVDGFAAGGVSAAMHGLTLTKGNPGGLEGGGAVRNNNGTLVLTHCTLSENSATVGSAIFSETPSITSSTTLEHCTVTGNTASLSNGAAIVNDRGRTTPRHCTVTGNKALQAVGSGVSSEGSNLTETLVRGCIIAGNSHSSVDFTVGGGAINSFTSLGSNLIDSGNAIGAFNKAGDVILTDPTPRLAALGNYGGPVKTMPPLSSSQATNAALGYPGATDQRGLAIGDYVYENDFATSELKGANVVLFNAATGAGTVDGGSFLLTPAAQSQVVSLVLPEPGAFNTFAASFDLRYTDPSGGTGNGGPADGMSFSFGPKPPAGLYTAEDGPPGAHRVSFNIFNSNGGVGRLKYIRPDGTEGAAVDFARFGDAGDFRAFTVTLDTAGTLRVTYKGALVFTVPNIDYSYQDGDTFTFAARTGGDVSEQRVDNIGIVTDPVGGRPDIGAVEGGLFPAGFAPVVTSAADTFGTGTGGLTLREAVDLAPVGSTITFDPAVFSGATPATNTITLGSNLPNLTRDVTIDATALPVGVTISGNNARRIVRVIGSGGSPSVGLRGLTLTGGKASDGGAILNGGGTLALERCTLHGNTASDGSNAGAIHSSGSGASLTLTHCTLTNNSATGVGQGGGILAIGSLTLRHCTVTANTADSFGGGVFYAVGNFTIENSIIAGNTGLGGVNNDIGHGLSATFTRVGTSIVQAQTGSPSLAGSGTLINAAPNLAPLGNYGGPTPTMPPLFGSPALDAAVDSTETTDQRGLPRAADADGNGTAVADIGAVELQVRLVTTAEDENDGTPESGVGAGTSLREAIADATGASDIVRFDPAVFTGATPATNTISLSINDGASAITVGNRLVSVDGSNIPAGVTIDDGNATTYRLFRFTSGAIVTMRGLTLANGGGPGFTNNEGGGAIFSENGTLTLERCTLSGNSAQQPGGAINSGTSSDFISSSTTLKHCTLTGNTTAGFGGAIVNSNGRTTLIHCTLSGNTAPAGQGSGVLSTGDNSTETVVRSCIISGNTNSSVDFMLGTGVNSFTSLGGNLIGSGNATGDFNQPGDIINDAPLLAPLANYGGPTQTMPPLPGSPAIDAAVGSTATHDQRGFSVVGTPDIGAVEAQDIPGFVPSVVTSADGGFDGVPNGVSLREALAFAPPGGTVTFDPALSGATVPFDEELLLDKNLVVDASALPGGLALDGGDTTRLFRIAAGRSVEMRAMTFTGGKADLGGAFRNEGLLTLRRCTLAGNAATTSGGAVHNLSQLLLEHCTLSGNEAPDGAGLLNAAAGTAELVHATLAANTATTDGGGVHNSGTLTLRQSLLSGNSAAGAGPDLREAAGSLTLEGINFVGDPAGSALAAGIGLLVGDPLLGPLADNGGPTLTHAPRRGSPAIDPPGGLTASPFAIDQRGLLRVSRGIVDIGAVEHQILRPVLVAPRLVKARSNGRATIRGSSRDAVRVLFSVAGQRGIKRTAGPPSRWIAKVSKLKRPLTRVSVTARSIDAIRAIKVVKVRKAR